VDVDDPDNFSYGSVNAVLVRDSTIYVGGSISRVNDLATGSLLAIDGSGRMRDWIDVAHDGAVWSIGDGGEHIVVGGAFSRIGSWTGGGLAELDPWRAPIGPPHASAIGLPSSYPNPAWRAVSVMFLTGESERVSLELLDVQGRSVRRVIDDVPYDAGAHRVTCDVSGCAPGVYFWRLSAGRDVRASKMVVVP
jgi:hypothetical protein